MQGQAKVRTREPLEQPVRQHAARPLADFFRRLCDQNQGAAPVILPLRQDSGHTDQTRHVNIMSASMRHRHLLSLRIRGGDRARVKQARFLLYRQRIQLRAHQYSRPHAVAHCAHHSVRSHAGSHLKTGLAQLLRHARRSLFLPPRQFRMRMQMLVQFEQTGILPAHQSLDRFVAG